MNSTKTRTSLSETTLSRTSSDASSDRKLTKLCTKSGATSAPPSQKLRVSTERSPKSVNLKPSVQQRSPSTNCAPDSPRSVCSEPPMIRRSPSITSSPNETRPVKQSPRSGNSKPSVNQRPPKITTPPNKQELAFKPSELRAKLKGFEEDLNKVKRQLVVVEKEKEKALAELEEAKRLAAEKNEKLSEAQYAWKQAEESFDGEKLRANDLEKVGIEAAKGREEERENELKSILEQQIIDISALASTNEELERLKNELSVASDAKNAAQIRDDDATKIAETSSQNVEKLSDELGNLKTMLDLKLESHANETAALVKRLNSEVDSLRRDLERAICAEEKLPEAKALIEALRIEVESATHRATDAGNLVDEWKKKADLLDVRAEEASSSERAASENLLSMMKQMEERNALLHDAESEITSLKCSIDSLEILLRRRKAELKELDWRLEMSKQETVEAVRTAENLKCVIQKTEEEKMQAMDSEALAALNVQNLLEEKNKLITELEASKREEEKSRKARESLKSALEEVSMEMNDVKDKLSATQAEIGYAESQIEDLRIVLKATEDNYEALVMKGQEEVSHLEKLVKKCQVEAENSRAALHEKEEEFMLAVKKSEEEIAAAKEDMKRLSETCKVEWEQKEFGFVDVLRRSDEELAAIKREKENLVALIKETEKEASATKDDSVRLLNLLNQVELGTKQALNEANADNIQRQEFLERENKVQLLTESNNEIRAREAAALKKAEELSQLLEEALSRKMEEENGDLFSSDEYDFVSKMVENGEDACEEKLGQPNSKFFSEKLEKHGVFIISEMDPMQLKDQNGNGYNGKGLVEGKMRDDTEQHSDNLNLRYGENVSSKQQQQRKKSFLFGGLLKKKKNPK